MQTESDTHSPYRRFAISARVFEAAAEKYPADQAEVFRFIFYLAKEQEWSLKKLERETKISTAVFSKIFRGTYEADTSSMAERLRQWRETYQASHQVTKPDFLHTSIADQVFFACEKATVAKVVVLLHGVYGLGKTEALEEYTRQHNHGKTLLIRCPSSGGVTTFLRHIARQIGENSRANSDSLRHAILDNVKKRAHLVIFDELHELFITGRADMALRCCEFIREIYDTCRVGIVLCGTQVLPDELTRGKFAKALGQLTDRGSGVEVALDPNVPDSDLALFYQHYGLPMPEGDAAELVDATLDQHSLRRLCFMLQDAQRLAKKRKQDLTWQHFLTVHDTLAGLRTRKERKPRRR